MEYYFSKTLPCPFEDALKKVTKELEKEGFGVISEIDIHEKLKEKLNVNFRKYRILGACNPPMAYKALLEEDKIGTMLPCNVIVQELDDNKVEIAAVDPVASMRAIENPSLEQIAIEIRNRLKRVVEFL